MKDRIEIEDYVRTREGYLGKLIAINEQDYNYLVVDTTRKIRNDGFPATYLYLKNEDIVKHSKNIIDLIEKDDIVNGYRVIELIRLNSEEISVCVYKNKEYMHCEILKEKDIKTILTKERYESNCYEVEE